MLKAVLSVLGEDRPGIVASVSALLAELECNIEDISQTILQGEFAAIFLFSLKAEHNFDKVAEIISATLKEQGLTIKLKQKAKQTFTPYVSTQPFILTAIGKDKPGQIAKLTQIIAEFGCNIANLRATYQSELYPDKVLMFYELDIPEDIDLMNFKEKIMNAAKDMGMEVTLQHKNIFENIHRI
ncbi:MAG: ACT domain-containing protein [Desulfonauticus sp.]|nr:ACT domain-containing protein [Desulfonauticus sp.]